MLQRDSFEMQILKCKMLWIEEKVGWMFGVILEQGVCLGATIIPNLAPATGPVAFVSMYRPTFDEFRSYAAGQTLVPVYRRLTAEALTPVSAFTLLPEADSSFLFESVVGGERIGRFSVVGSGPWLTITAYGKRLVVESDGKREERESADPFADLAALLAAHRSPHVPGLPRFAGGAVGYAGYDTVRYAERLPHPPEDDRRLPDMQFAFYDQMVVFDHINKTVLVIAHARTDVGDPRENYEEACRRVDELAERLRQGATKISPADIALDREADLSSWSSNTTREGYCQAVRRAKEYIRAGDAFQIVLSQRLSRETTARPLDIYRALRIVNPSPFMFLLRSPEVTLIGSSPEIMVRVEDGETTIRPLAGTRRRGATPAEDDRLAEELLADPKERAEHVMLIDLARNDVGRVSKYGSVKISDVMVVERYSHVMHITSNVTGQLLEGKSALDALRVGLPAGTVSGAPKVRAMEIIDELEPHRRGPYAGAVGYIDFTGNMDTCIALRTIVMRGDTAYVQAGAGLVADSVPETEYEETLSKARGLLKAIEIAENQLSSLMVSS